MKWNNTSTGYDDSLVNQTNQVVYQCMNVSLKRNHTSNRIPYLRKSYRSKFTIRSSFQTHFEQKQSFVKLTRRDGWRISLRIQLGQVTRIYLYLYYNVSYINVQTKTPGIIFMWSHAYGFPFNALDPLE